MDSVPPISVNVTKNKRPTRVERFLSRLKNGPIPYVIAFALLGSVGTFLAYASTTDYSLWSSNSIPKTITATDSNSVELGLKFQSKYAGKITGVKFYKGAQNTGTHTGTLWDSKGDDLASVTFTNESASGWQTAMFPQPIPIAANVAYVISYHAPNGKYSDTANYFTKRYKHGPLTALRNTTASGNGVYIYSKTTAFPTQSYQASNYWVDVIFSTNRISPPVTPAPPLGVTATQSGNSITITWQAAQTANTVSKYLLFRNGQQLSSTSTNTLGYVDNSGLIPGTTYSYQLKTVDGSGLTSSFSPTATVTFNVAPTPPTPPITSTGYVQVCGVQLCLNGQPFVIHGATAYGTYGSPSSEIAMAQAAKVNVLELVEFDTQYHTLSDTMSPATWSRLDNFIALAGRAGIHVILNLSEYGQSLQAAGQTPTTTDWQNYLTFIANRTNTVTGVQYKNDPTIAMVEIFGEIDAPNYAIHPGTEGTSAQMTSFFQRTMSEWKTLAPNILVSTGGFSYINDPNSGIDWQTIVKDPNNATCDMEINSSQDATITAQNFPAYCKQLGKPWFLSAWSACYGSPAKGYNYYATDSAMAAHAQAMYSIAKGGSPAAMPAVGADFWNLQDQGTQTNTCSISPNFPLTFGVIQNTAP